jgi:cobalt/nickel transport system permease protein
MHIPDGYLGPPTSAVMYTVMVPIWAIAANKVKKELKTRQIPLLAIAAAFSFVIMMFNIPIPGGSTGHAVGGVIAAILLGPWAASIVITVVLVIQALLFGDGGITAIGANSFNMAFVLPFVGYYVFKLFAGNSKPGSVRQIFAAGAGGYIGLNIAAICAGIEFGLQPLLHHNSAGQALYCPYGLNIAIPAMAIEHLLIFGWVEAIVTSLVLVYVTKQMPEVINEEVASA